MSNPFLGGYHFLSRSDAREIVCTSWSREKELKQRCHEAHEYFLKLSKGKDNVGRMEAMARASYKYGLNYRSIYNGRPTVDL